ncbi:hypothetical protein [Aeromonas veronii]|uniref:hypothetical protein n=1 Tax=Aeromonas veronii TaxID=654 RepID=UPI002445080F|nr:hypothetical protein [Aeromonas veronii]
MLILNVVTETPLWVWILFSFLVGIGINALRDREMSIRGLFIMPLFFLLWGGISVIDELTFLYWGLVAMSVGGPARLWCWLVAFEQWTSIEA